MGHVRGIFPGNINSLFLQIQVAFNSIRKGNGDVTTEERKPIPFKTGDLVNIRIQILQNGYQVQDFTHFPGLKRMPWYTVSFEVFFNDREFYVYKSRMPFTPITHLRIFGNGSITEAYLEEKYNVRTVIHRIEKKINVVLAYFLQITAFENNKKCISQPIPLDSSFANGFPMCYKESCSTQREWYLRRQMQIMQFSPHAQVH